MKRFAYKHGFGLMLLLVVLFHRISYADKIDWVKTFGGIKDENIDHVLVCPNNDIIVIGTFSDTLYFKSGSKNADTLICENQYEDVFIVKFHSHGTFQWAKSLAHGPDSYDWWLHPAVDSEGNLFLSGTFIGEITIGKNDENETIFSVPAGNSLDIFLTRILDDGQIDWAIRIGDQNQEQLWNITSARDGSVYLTGRFLGDQIFFPGGENDDIILTGNQTGSNIYTVKYDKNANIGWANKILNTYDMLSYAVATSDSGKVAISGYYIDNIILDTPTGTVNLKSKGLADIFIVTYDSLGNYLWSVSEGGEQYEQAWDIAFDSQDNVIITGSMQDMVIMGDKDTLVSDEGWFENHDDILLAKYDVHGNYLWSLIEGGPMLDGGERLQIYKNDNILLSGFYWIEATFDKRNNHPKTISNVQDTSSHFAAKYTPGGELFWVADVDSLFNTFNTNIVMDSAGNSIRAGQYGGEIDLQSEENSVGISSSGGMDIYLAKFSPSVTSVNKTYSQPMRFQLFQNYPNPFNPTTIINYIVGANRNSPVHVELSIYNLLGQKVATLVNKKQFTGSYSVQWNASGFASGLYLYKLTIANDFQQTRKLLLLK